MFDDKGMLTDRARGILFWFTISMIALLAIIAIITILRACGGLVSQVSPTLVISPGEISLCAGEQHQFTIEGGAEVTWEAMGGTITQSGFFSAGDVPGDYTVIVSGRDSRQEATATVHIIACTPTEMPVLPTPTPLATPTPEVVAPPSADPQGDVGAYESGVPVGGAPAGLDIRVASVGPDARVVLQPTEGVPEELAGWAGEDEILLWIVLHEPIPDPPAAYVSWLFVLDVDGDTATGRPAGSRRINPDLGDEAVIGVSYDPATGSYDPYFLVWDAAQGSWVAWSEGVRYYLGESRAVIALALPLETLTQSIAQTSGVTLAPEAVKGRAAADSYAGEQRVIDFYPDLP